MFLNINYIIKYLIKIMELILINLILTTFIICYILYIKYNLIPQIRVKSPVVPIFQKHVIVKNNLMDKLFNNEIQLDLEANKLNILK